jgi:hypothetical protein
MRPIKFEGCDTINVAPEDIKGNCLPLPTQSGIDFDGNHFMVSAWVPNVDDLKALNEGRPMFLKVVGFSTPPVLLFTENSEGEMNT